MEPWLNQLITILVTSGVTVFGLWLTGKTQKRAHATQVVQVTNEHELGLADRWQAWADTQTAARERTEQKVDHLDEEVTKLKREVLKFRGWIDDLVSYIQRLQAWAAEVTHHTPPPLAPPRIAHLLEGKEDPDGS